DGNSYLQWAIPADGTEQLHGIKLNTEGTRADTVQRAMATHAPQVTKAVDLAQGGKGFLYMSPLFLKNRFDGFIVAAFSLRVIYDKMLLRDKGGPFYLTVREGDDLVYSNTPDNYVQPERWSKSATFQNKDNIWTITVAPQPELLAKKNSPLPNLVLITGLLTSFFATVSVLFALRSRRVTAIVRENEERLGQVIATYDLLVATGYEIDTFMKILVERVEVLTEGTGAVIELIEGNEMVYKAASGSVESFVGFRLNRVGSMSGLCVEQGEIIVCDDTSKDPRVNYEACKKVGANSMVVVPLMQHEGVVGVLKVVSSRTHAFDAEHIRTLQLMAGLLGATLGQQIEMDRRMKLEEELRHMAQYDGLTGMPNRTLFRDRLTQALINNARSGKTLGVMFMDIDHFKTINDKYGHADGDELLKQFAARIASALRKGDTLARLGGDEFTVIAENLNNPADAEHVARKILDAMKAPFELPNVTLPIGVSIGVAVTDKKTVGFDYILGRADDALYEVKRAGRNNYKLVSV
ncbi:MAG TPA: diguanylate cyclase, partial [Alphaproteobacteria bacterium]|nr:diguanylate cyclase [Alphaproteobacteria bacterium]